MKISNRDLTVSDITLTLTRDGQEYVCVVEDGIQLVREANVASKLTCAILRDAITAERGDGVLLTVGEKNVFWGVIVSTSKELKWCTIEAYDQLWYLSKNKGWYVYENKTATEVVKDAQGMCQLICTGKFFHDTGYKLPYRVEDNVSYLDMILNALEQTKTYTGKQWYLYDDCRDLRLVTEGFLMAQVHLNVQMSYVEDYSIKESIQDIATEVAIGYNPQSEEDESAEGTETEDTEQQQPEQPEEEERDKPSITLKAYAFNEALYQRYGKITATDTADEGEDPVVKAQNLLNELSVEPFDLSLSGVQGDLEVRGGTPIWIDFFTNDNLEYVRGWFRVNSVTHNFNGGLHTMDLDVSLMKMHNDWNDRSGKVIDL